jgi:hypothetical protein
MHKQVITILLILLFYRSISQEYYLQAYAPFSKDIPTPEQFLHYPVGEWHTRHDQIIAYFEHLAKISDNAELIDYGKTYEGRRLVILVIADKTLLQNNEQIRTEHLQYIQNQSNAKKITDQKLIVYLGHNIHGNEPSGGESAMLTAYTLLSSQKPEIKEWLNKGIIFIDPVINPDGRERHTLWANTHRAFPANSDPNDIEHNEMWPGGRSNHYWFDLNRDLLLAIHPESKARLDWFHLWYPNITTDHHEMGKNQSFFFEPKSKFGLQKEIIPKENHYTLNPLFEKAFAKTMDSIGNFYFSGEIFDATYPGYGSTYMDLHGSLALLFEQAGARGIVQETENQTLSFSFTIRNQYLMALTTLKTAFANQAMLLEYQKEFFSSAFLQAKKDPVKAYVFGDFNDKNRTKAFIDLLLQHKIDVFELNQSINQGGKQFNAGEAFVVPTAQLQYRMVQSIFETYQNFADSAWYDASAWSLVHFYNMPYAGSSSAVSMGKKISETENLYKANPTEKADYAYLVNWCDNNSAAFLAAMHQANIKCYSAFKPFVSYIMGQQYKWGYGTLMIPVSLQSIDATKLHGIIAEVAQKTNTEVKAVNSGFSAEGSHLGSGNFRVLEAPKVLLIVHGSVSGYEAGEMWHFFDQKLHYPLTKIRMEQFRRIDLEKYNTLIMVSGSYSELDTSDKNRIALWLQKGNTLITTRTANLWAISNQLAHEKLVEINKSENKDETKAILRLPYTEAEARAGAKEIGGAIFKASIDITHPIGFGYTQTEIPVYRNSGVFLQASINPYSTVLKYSSSPLINGYISQYNLNNYLMPSASVVVSPAGAGRIIMMADNPIFRASWIGTERLLYNSIFLGHQISVPSY